MTKTARALLLVPWSWPAGALAARPCLASGFLIYDISGQAIGRASAVSADVDEPAAVWFNPANLVYMGGVSASAGGVFVTSKSSFSPAGGGAETSSERGNFFLPAVFANGRITIASRWGWASTRPSASASPGRPTGWGARPRSRPRSRR